MKLRRILSAMGIYGVGESNDLFAPVRLAGSGIEPEIDGLLHRGRCERERYFAPFAGRGISGVKRMHDGQSIFPRDFRTFFSTGAAREMIQLLRRAVVPQLL